MRLNPNSGLLVIFFHSTHDLFNRHQKSSLEKMQFNFQFCVLLYVYINPGQAACDLVIWTIKTFELLCFLISSVFVLFDDRTYQQQRTLFNSILVFVPHLAYAVPLLPDCMAIHSQPSRLYQWTSSHTPITVNLFSSLKGHKVKTKQIKQALMMEQLVNVGAFLQVGSLLISVNGLNSI